MPIELGGQRVAIIGASSGIGAALATLAAKRGARVAAIARRADRLDAFADANEGCVGIQADVTDEASIRAAIDAAVAAFGGLDAAVYAAAMSPLRPMGSATQDDWRAVFDTNVIGAALVASSAAPHLLATRGRLVVLSSKSARQPFPDLGLYATSKAALDGLLRCLPVEFPGLLVTRVVVGNTHSTDFATSWDTASLTSAIHRWAADGLIGSTETMHPDDVAEAILQVLTSTAHIDELAVIDPPMSDDNPAQRGRVT